LKFVEHQKEQGEKRLFPELNYSDVGGYGRNVSRNFAEVTKRLGIWVERKKVFHSFRSTFNGRLMKLGTSQELREFLLGHANDSMNVQAYGKQIEDRPYIQLYEEVKKVDFGLTHKAWEPALKLPSL
jgi:integrase